jgi:hypothetical protein
MERILMKYRADIVVQTAAKKLMMCAKADASYQIMSCRLIR